MVFSLPPLFAEQPAGSGDGEEDVVFLQPSADFPKFVLRGDGVENHGELGDMGCGGVVWGWWWWWWGGGRLPALALPLPLPFSAAFGLILVLVPAQVLVAEEVGGGGAGARCFPFPLKSFLLGWGSSGTGISFS